MINNYESSSITGVQLSIKKMLKKKRGQKSKQEGKTKMRVPTMHATFLKKPQKHVPLGTIPQNPCHAVKTTN